MNKKSWYSWGLTVFLLGVGAAMFQSIFEDIREVNAEINGMVDKVWIVPFCEEKETDSKGFSCAFVKDKLSVHPRAINGLLPASHKHNTHIKLSVELGKLAWLNKGVNIDPDNTRLLVKTGCLFNRYGCRFSNMPNEVFIHNPSCRYEALKAFPNLKPIELWTDKEIWETPHPTDPRYPEAMIKMAASYIKDNEDRLCNHLLKEKGVTQ